MAKNSKRELLCITLFLMVLLSSSAYAYLVPSAQAAEPTTPEKGLSILSNTVELDLSKYAVTTKVYPQNYNSSYLGVVAQEDVEYECTSEGSKVKTLCTFTNSRLQMIHVLENEGSPHLSKTAANPLELAQNFLANYQAYTADSLYGELKATLDNVDAGKNNTKTEGNTQLEVIANNGYTTFKWTYTANGAIASAKFVSLGFNNSCLTCFVDNWQLYPIGSTTVNLSEKEAVAIALDAAKAHQWSLELDADALETANFNESNVCWTNLIFDGSLYADKTRNEDSLMLYPVWRVGIALNKWYGNMYGITVDIWADTKEVRIVEEAWSTMTPAEGTPTANMTAVSKTIAQESVTAGEMPNLNIWIALATIAIATIGTTSVYVRRKKTQSYNWPKLRSLKNAVTLLCILILSIVLLAPIATVSATTRAGVIWGSESEGAINPGTGEHWRKHATEIYWQNSIASTIESYFDQGGYDSGLQSDQQGKPGSKKINILGNITDLTNSYDCVAVVDFDHGVGNTENVPGAPSGEFHYMFEDNNGTIGGPDWDNRWTDNGNGVYDHEIYSNQTIKGKVFFAFISTCLSACINDTIPEFGDTTQGIIPGTDRARGMPFAWTNRTVAGRSEPGFTTALNMSDDGYINPDDGAQCYIGFPYGSASLMQRIPYIGGSQYYHQWVDGFFDYALRYDMSVNMALDHASWQTWGLRFGDCKLRNSFTCYWWNCTPETADYCTMAVYGNGNVKLRYYSPGWNDNFNDNSMDTAKWEELEVNGATASETTGQLAATVPSGDETWAQAGYVTKYSYNIKDCNITINVSDFDDLDEMILQICTTNTTNSDPIYENNWYRILKASYDPKVCVQSKIDGGDVNTKAVMDRAGATGTLSIDICDGAIAFCENGNIRYSEPYALSSYDCYIYAFASALKSRSSGTDKFDDFTLAPTTSFYDNFDDADNYVGWANTSGSWEVTDGKLRAVVYDSHIYVNKTFSINRHVTTDIQTTTHSGDPWNVPWLFAKEQDGDNVVYALIHTNGNVELARIYQGDKDNWFNSTSLDPCELHVLTVSIIGTNAKVWVDGTLYLNVDDEYFDNLAGYVGLYTPSSRGRFDNVVIMD